MARATFPAFGERLRGLFKARGIDNQSEFARQHKGLTPAKVSRWLRGSLPQSQDDLEALARALGVAWEWLLIGDEGLKAMGALSPRHPIVVRRDRDFAIARYRESAPSGISVYEVTDEKIRDIRHAETLANKIKMDEKL